MTAAPPPLAGAQAASRSTGAGPVLPAATVSPGSAPRPVALRHAGVGLRHAHLADALADPVAGQPVPAFVEVHAENYFADGGAALRDLEAARALWPVSVHGVGLALGSAAGVDRWHLDRLARLVQRIDPARVSDHACFGRVAAAPGLAAQHACDLLPLAFTPAALAILVRNVQRVQDRLKRPILVENLAAYLRWSDDSLDEPAFFNALCRQSGCAVLLDVNNLVVNARNQPCGNDGAAVAQACAWIDRLDSGIVGQIHLAGHDDSGDLVIDDHGSRVPDAVWQVFAHAVRRLGPQPALVEWDHALPLWPVLLAEAAQADAVSVAQARPC